MKKTKTKDIPSYCCKAEIKRRGKYNYICAACGRSQIIYLLSLPKENKYGKNKKQIPTETE